METQVNVLSLVPLSEEAKAEIEAIDGSVQVTAAPGWFDGEIRDTWGDFTVRSYLRRDSTGVGTRSERDDLLAQTDVILAGFPVPLDLRARAPRLRWFHQTPAGASNLRRCDLWASDVTVTTSRGFGNTLAIAEYVVATFALFARGLHRAGVDRSVGDFDRFAYRPIQLAGKTVCVVGAGGIGAEVGRLCAALGMRVVGTRRTPEREALAGFDRVEAPGRLHELLADAQFVAVCCQWTNETRNLIDADALEAMTDDAVLVNIARGEIVDEAALANALERLRGVALDVYVGEFERLPPTALWEHPNVIVTPHISAGSDQAALRPLALFRDNLRALLDDRPLTNVIDWERGY